MSQPTVIVIFCGNQFWRIIFISVVAWDDWFSMSTTTLSFVGAWAESFWVLLDGRALLFMSGLISDWLSPSSVPNILFSINFNWLCSTRLEDPFLFFLLKSMILLVLPFIFLALKFEFFLAYVFFDLMSRAALECVEMYCLSCLGWKKISIFESFHPHNPNLKFQHSCSSCRIKL